MVAKEPTVRCRHPPPRPDARAVVAVGRRQVDDRAQPAGKRSEPRTVGQRHHAPAPRQRDRRRPLPFPSRSASSSACAIPTRCWNGPRCTAIATPRRASRPKLAMAEGRDMLFDIDWQGAAAAEGEDARRHRLDLHPAAVDDGIEVAAEAPRRGPGGGDRDAAEECPRTRSSTGANMTIVVVNDDLDRAFAESAASSPPSGCAATAGPACSISFRACWTKRPTRGEPRLLRHTLEMLEISPVDIVKPTIRTPVCYPLS